MAQVQEWVAEEPAHQDTPERGGAIRDPGKFEGPGEIGQGLSRLGEEAGRGAQETRTIPLGVPHRHRRHRVHGEGGYA
ncbi:MAG: hypothetical protein JRI25_23230 [Deltaproteobacteria bacterium]|nr:hypothetical protein [Deltaproteobacteria bacterium]